MPWGNRFAFLPLPIPKLTATESSNPLSFVLEAHQIIQRQRNSTSVLLTSYLMETMRKVKGPEAVARYMRGILKNSSMAITNLIGPVEQMSLADHPVKGIYFAVPGDPQSLHITVISYAGKLRICLVTEKDFIDPCKFKSCINNAFEAILEAAVQTSPQKIN
ncbi:wax ester synthase/diacylglycerol acyltransferase 9-like [Coffea arabica]|uniref:Wax ester synthase/diacylglycerol acyltransferase 9-like n=1 Tax=Coffea arabica TaxID=13443 RepID=A0ABM4UF27_COFAR